MDVCASFVWWVGCNICWRSYRYTYNCIIIIQNRRIKRANLKEEIELLKKEIKRTARSQSMGTGDNK